MPSVWYRSDDHLGHKNIIEYTNRPWETVEEMNEALIEAHNAVVQPGDTVYYLGDATLNTTSVALLKQMNGWINLIPGNHDPVHPMKKKWKRALPAYHDAGVSVMDTQVKDHINGTSVLMCHFPYFGQRKGHGYDDKFSGVRPDDHGGWLLCGHVHQAWKQRNRQINVGVDVWDYQPVHRDQIAELIANGPGRIDGPQTVAETEP